MKNRVMIQVVVTVVVSVFGIGIWSIGGHPQFAWLRFFSVAVLVATAVLWLWDRVLWKTTLAQKFSATPRDVSGTWRGTLESSWINPETGKKQRPKAAYLVIRQTASSVSVILLTDESKSVSSLGTVSGAAGVRSLDYMYLNKPQVKVEDRSRMHHGSTSLDISGDPPTRLRGRYWTDRDTKGELDFFARDKRRVESFDEAAAVFPS